MATTTCEVWVCVDAEGDYEVGAEESEAVGRCNDLNGPTGRRVVRLTVTVPVPEQIDVDVTIDDTDPAATVTVK